jgi:hypothetical protein
MCASYRREEAARDGRRDLSAASDQGRSTDTSACGKHPDLYSKHEVEEWLLRCAISVGDECEPPCSPSLPRHFTPTHTSIHLPHFAEEFLAHEVTGGAMRRLSREDITHVGNGFQQAKALGEWETLRDLFTNCRYN